MDTLFAAFWFFLPAGVANVVPIIISRLPVISGWSYPLDGNLRWGRRRLLGSHKTWRGLVAGVLCAVAIVWLQQQMVRGTDALTPVLPLLPGYLHASPLVLGLLLGGGALGGDAIESFFKRRLGKTPGKSWLPYDQVDYILGACVLSVIVIRLSIVIYITGILLWFIIHLVATYIGYLIRLKEQPI